MGMLIRLIITAVALLVIANLSLGIHVSGITAALIAALVLGIVNAIVRPILVMLTLPLTVLSLGLFLLVINGLTFWLTGLLVPGFKVDTLVAGIIGAVLLWAISLVASWFVKK
ncbi:MAG: phage holin family protein [Chloroflexota bacterium]